MVRKTDEQKSITIMINKGADVLDHYNIDLLLKRREGEKNPKKHSQKKRKKRSRYVALDFSADLFHAQKKQDEGGDCDRKIRHHVFFFFFVSLVLFLFVSSSSLNGFVVEKLVSSIQRKVSEYIWTNEMGFFCCNNTHTHLLHEGKEEE